MPVEEHLQQVPQSLSFDEQEDQTPAEQVFVPVHVPEPHDSVKNSSICPSQLSSLLLQVSVVGSIEPVQEDHCPFEHVWVPFLHSPISEPHSLVEPSTQSQPSSVWPSQLLSMLSHISWTPGRIDASLSLQS